MKYPDCYLHVEECRSGQSWIIPISEQDTIDLKTQVNRWIQSEFAGELELAYELIPKLSGDYYARIMTDGRPPESVVCWTGGGFYLKSPELSADELDATKA